MRRAEGEVAHCLLVTVCESRDARRASAGEDPSKAKYNPRDDRYMLEKVDSSFHYEVFLSR